EVMAGAAAVAAPPQAAIEQVLDLAGLLQVFGRPPRLKPVLHDDLPPLLSGDLDIPFRPRLPGRLFDELLGRLVLGRRAEPLLAAFPELALVDDNGPEQGPRLPVANTIATALVQLQHRNTQAAEQEAHLPGGPREPQPWLGKPTCPPGLVQCRVRPSC